ncbi:MAG TPA: polysaccharide deacetylase family protein [Kofleriaceae bacterium]|nr:polysaccharide deacetylase family protein [Kofleriaceae bacterium]
MAGDECVESGKLQLLKWLAKGLVAEFCSYSPVRRVVCWRSDRRGRKVALTFDDGPDPIHTREVLDVLESKSVRSTFFVLGQAIERNPRVFQDIVDAGHEIGIHGYNHKLADMSSQTRRTLEIVSRFGVRSSLFRPPHGILEPATGLWMALNRMSVVLWSVDARDSLRHERKTPPGSHDSFDRIRGGDIVLLHDDNPQCAMDVREILDVLDREGLDAAPVSALLAAA